MKKLFCVLMLVALMLCSCVSQSSGELFAMDTYMHVTVYGEKALVDDAKAMINGLDARFSVSGASGEVYALVQNGRIDAPSEELLEMLGCAKMLYERTGGAYDITALALTRLWQSCEDGDREPTSDEINAALALVGMDKIAFDENAVVLNGAAGIDLGSIAKGYTGQAVSDGLLKSGAKGGILSLGGNVTVFGEKLDGGTFKVGITDPHSPESVCGYVELDGGHVVTSGKYNRSFEINGKAYHHIIDARTGLPCDNGVASVTVIADNGMWADALSTALLLLGKDGALQYYAQYGGFEAIIIMDDGTCVTTSENLTFVRE